MKNRFLLAAVLMVSSGFAAEDLVLEDGVPRVFTGGTEDVGKIIYPAGVWGTYTEGSLTLDGTVMTAETSSWPGSYYQNGLLDLRNGASLTFSAAVWFATCSSGYVNGLITVDDSTLTFSQNLSIGGGAYHANTGSSEIRGQNNATIAFNGDVTWLGFAIAQEFRGGFWLAFWACLMMLLSGLTDAWDGKLARKWGVVSTLGKMADPLMDKVFYIVAFPALVWQIMHQGESDAHAVVMMFFQPFTTFVMKVFTALNTVSTTVLIALIAVIYAINDFPEEFSPYKHVIRPCGMPL